MTAHLTRNQTPRPEHPPTPRQREMIALTLEGQGNRQIARRLFVSDSTVRNTLRDAYARLGLAGASGARTRAAVWYWRETEGGRGG